MSLPRALVIRSGANPFLPLGGSSRVQIVEKASHSIEGVEPDKTLLATPPDLTIFTSQVAVERLFGESRLAPGFREEAASGRIVAVGTATAEALAAHGAAAALVAGGSAGRILEQLPLQMGGQRVLLPCGEDSSDELPEGLRSRGAQVTRLILYRKVPRPRDVALEREIVERPFAAFCTTSPSAARWLFAGLGEAAASRLRATPAVVLGRFTRRFLESHGVARIEVTEKARFSEAVALLEKLATAPGRK